MKKIDSIVANEFKQTIRNQYSLLRRRFLDQMTSQHLGTQDYPHPYDASPPPSKNEISQSANTPYILKIVLSIIGVLTFLLFTVLLIRKVRSHLIKKQREDNLQQTSQMNQQQTQYQLNSQQLPLQQQIQHQNIQLAQVSSSLQLINNPILSQFQQYPSVNPQNLSRYHQMLGGINFVQNMQNDNLLSNLISPQLSAEHQMINDFMFKQQSGQQQQQFYQNNNLNFQIPFQDKIDSAIPYLHQNSQNNLLSSKQENVNNTNSSKNISNFSENSRKLSELSTHYSIQKQAKVVENFETPTPSGMFDEQIIKEENPIQQINNKNQEQNMLSSMSFQQSVSNYQPNLDSSAIANQNFQNQLLALMQSKVEGMNSEEKNFQLIQIPSKIQGEEIDEQIQYQNESNNFNNQPPFSQFNFSSINQNKKVIEQKNQDLDIKNNIVQQQVVEQESSIKEGPSIDQKFEEKNQEQIECSNQFQKKKKNKEAYFKLIGKVNKDYQQEQEKKRELVTLTGSFVENEESNLEENKKLQSDGVVCGVCLCKPPRVVIQCGHVLCENCVMQVRECPFCFKAILSTQVISFE